MKQNNNYSLQVEKLYKSFSGVTAVNYISFEIAAGEVVGFLGSNGAGKTTTIQMLLSTMTPTSGKISYFGKDFFRNRSESLQQISFASTYVRLPGKLTVQENLEFYGKLYGLNAAQRSQRIEKFLKAFDMWDLRHRYAGGLSAGETTRVILAKAFLNYPKLVLLDEPTASLDPDISHQVRHFVIEQQRELGTSILFTSHNMDEVTEVCDRVIVLKKGTIIANDTPERLAASVSLTKVQLRANPEMLLRIAQFALEENLKIIKEEKSVQIEIDEQKIAPFLTALAQKDISYTHIAINTPTLEDYFLQTMRKEAS